MLYVAEIFLGDPYMGMHAWSHTENLAHDHSISDCHLSPTEVTSRKAVGDFRDHPLMWPPRSARPNRLRALWLSRLGVSYYWIAQPWRDTIENARFKAWWRLSHQIAHQWWLAHSQLVSETFGLFSSTIVLRHTVRPDNYFVESIIIG